MNTEQSLFERIGGRPTVDALVHRFYELMDTAPEAEAVRATHPEDLTRAIEKLADFLTGWMGGPPVYVQKHGHPRLRARHMPFVIGVRERDEWLWCMGHALVDVGIDEMTRNLLMGAFGRMADHMRNQPT